ncbi:hypothetical protein HD806DRAFT_494897 [Xylariaceae sp. AK1471]|nr:hypothetical protein HD806DRAFT_494897 [Xylariaceae sp. AK1471]
MHGARQEEIAMADGSLISVKGNRRAKAGKLLFLIVDNFTLLPSVPSSTNTNLATHFLFLSLIFGRPLRPHVEGMFGSRSLLALAGWGVSVAAATEVVYVTDLEIFTVLAPCAQSAVSGVIQYETVQNCPEAVTELQSCICSKNGGNNLASISSAISESLDYTCGATATDDQASAATVVAAYCNQDSITPFPSPSITVSQYVTDLPAYQNLAPCAASGLSEVVLSMTNDKCQEDASLLAPCACDKNQNSLLASAQINTSVKWYCSSHTLDISSAQAVFAGYCGLVHGTTSFPDTTNPPGDMTYYITALDEFSRLAPCAQSAVSYNVLSQTNDVCPSGPQALASCACLRSDMTGTISSLITSDVKYSCESTATEDISSALAVWDLYCSAAKGLTTLADITESISQPSPTAKTPTSGPNQTGKLSASGPGSSPSNGSGDGQNNTSNGMTGGNTMSNTGVIAGAVVGAVIGTALIAVVAFLLYRRSRKAKAEVAAFVPVVVPESDNAKPELDNTSIAPPPAVSPSLSMMKNRMENSSPVSAISGLNSPHGSELPGQSPFQQPPPMPELHNQAAYSQTSELQGQSKYSLQTRHEAYSQQVYNAHGPPMSELHGMGWQSGPVSNAYEMDAGQQSPHAR